ncbi:hypothetical protein [Ichthyenterobacterium magnum]|uniref:Uncharacterized protein n=1 Tax=Ichthyenterobacterium magnum TaxID=1230530 RepID=A0A420DBY3_9FLAO|nr:hypothetical protein [Ichthyenterobacterium magnum]RKE89440.1 hypothetical protein BXY80_2789 [Ichthyenterobacterium magnum]
MTDYYRLWKTLFILKDFLIEHSKNTFSSFDLTNDANQVHGNSFKFIVKNAEEVMYFLKFYDLSENLTEKDIDKMYEEKGFNNSDKISLILFI